MDSSHDWRLRLLILLITWLLDTGIVRYFNAFLTSCRLPIMKIEVSSITGRDLGFCVQCGEAALAA